MAMGQQRAIIIGAGPAGLTAAYELLTRAGIQPIVLEKSESMGGIARTVNYKGNRMDIGGHRFFSKSDRVMDWWLKMLPLETSGDSEQTIRYNASCCCGRASPASITCAASSNTLSPLPGTPC
jgi:monoamine oxidase